MRSSVTDGWRGLGRSLRGLPLLPAVFLAVAGAVAIVLLATWILRVVIPTSAKEADPIDITKLSFTVAGGVGAAAAQLGDHDVAIDADDGVGTPAFKLYVHLRQLNRDVRNVYEHFGL
jgi:hypothetical protein